MESGIRPTPPCRSRAVARGDPVRPRRESGGVHHRISVAYEAALLAHFLTFPCHTRQDGPVNSSLDAVVYSSSDDEGLWNGRAKVAPRRGRCGAAREDCGELATQGARTGRNEAR